MKTQVRFSICTICMWLLVLSLHSQTIDWKEGPDETYVYRISNAEARKLLKSAPRDSLVLKMLHTPVDTFVKVWKNEPEQGHFVFANIHKNRVNYRYQAVTPFQVFLFKEYGVLTLQVVDRNGEIRSDAKVKLNHHYLDYDKESQTYTVNDWSEREQRILTVELDKFQAVFNLRKHLISPWNNRWDNPGDSPAFYSYLVTDKNKYKPGETIRFKSYALSSARRPLKDELYVWMRVSQSWNDYKKISPVLPYHPGGFAGEIQLHDSLKLELDRKYSIQLRDKRGRIVASANFSYEDYELYANKLELKIDSGAHYYPRTKKLEIAVTDANGLFLQDMQAEITIKRNDVLHAHTNMLILPDTLLNCRVNLDPAKPTTFEIPSDIFGASDCAYSVSVVVLTFDNQRMEQQARCIYYRSVCDIDQTIRQDTLVRFAFRELGEEKEMEALLSYNNAGEQKKIRLPYEEPFNQNLGSYTIEVPGASFKKSFYVETIHNGLKLEGGIEKDSLCLHLLNPLQLELSWYVYEGNTLLQKGAGKELEVKCGGIIPRTTYYVEIFYSMGGKEMTHRRTYAASPDKLTVDVDLPEHIYPGQKLESTIRVTDHQGRPAKDVDLTAFSVNSQLDYDIPELPYYGASPDVREQRSSYSMSDKNYLLSAPLNYAYWNPRAGLDKMKFYQFTYPGNKLFTYTVPTTDSTTQFAPYVMKNGEEVHVYVIELNDVPVYFSWTNQTKAYSFPVDSRVDHKITLRLHDRILVIPSIRFEAGEKTLLSFDLNHLPPGIHEMKIYTKDKYKRHIFTPTEVAKYKKWIALFPVDVNRGYNDFKSGKTVYPIYNQYLDRPKSFVLAGPLPECHGTYTGGVTYKHEGGYAYVFEDNVVYKIPGDKLMPEYLLHSSSNALGTLNDFYFTPGVFEAKVAEARRKFQWNPSSIYIDVPGYKMRFTLPVEKDSTGVSNLLFEHVETKKVIFPDNHLKDRRDYSSLPRGIYHIILLYNNGKFLKKEGVTVTPHTFMQLNLSRLELHEPDSISRHWLTLSTGSTPIGTLQPVHTTYMLRQYTRGFGNRISGYITDSSGEPLIGASVTIKNTSLGTVTDLDGYFSLEVMNATNDIVLSYIGYERKELRVDANTEIKAVMEESAQYLDEVVVVGFGTRQKSSLTGRLAGLSVSTSDASGLSSPPEKPDDTANEEEARQAEEKLYYELMQLNGLRKNFSDVGFWEPRLFTDSQGQATFSVTFPDNITKWETVIYAMNRKLKTGVSRKSVRSYKPLMTELKTPQFLTVGDSAWLAGTTRNYTKDPSIHGKTTFVLQQDTLKRESVQFANACNEKLFVHATSADSITAQYFFTRDDGYMDGEERILPVVRQGTEIAKGTLGILRNGDTVELNADGNEEIHLTLADSQLDVYLEASDYLRGYAFACNEQLASKLIGLLGYKSYIEFTGKKFKSDNQVRELVRRLMKNRNKDKLWSWWGNSSKISYWMSGHILRALSMAKEAGYEVELKGVEQDYSMVHPYRNSNLNDVETLHAFSGMGVVQDYERSVNVLQAMVRRAEAHEDSIARREKNYQPLSYLREKLLLWEILQQQNIAQVTDSIRPYLHKDILGRVYCDDGKRERYWHAGKLINTLSAYRMVRKDTTLRAMTEPMQLYIVGCKSAGWNTYQASSAVATVLPDLLVASSTKEKTATVQLSGKENTEATRFPYETTLSPGEHLSLYKKDGMPLFISSYSVKRVTSANVGEGFEVSTSLSNDILEAGVPVKMTVHLKVKQHGAEHIMIEAPIPAACSYVSKPNYFYSASETHREYYKEKVVVFCEQLPQGTYEYTIDLLPRYTGSYILNPAKVELMYFPVVHANNELRTVKVGEKTEIVVEKAEKVAF